LRKAVLIAVMLFVCSVGLMPSIDAEQTGYHWVDHFDYASNEEATAAGWNLVIPGETSFSSSTVVLGGNPTDNSMNFHDFPAGITDWRAEIKGKWTAGSGGSIGVALSTDRQFYDFWLDGYYSVYIFSVGSSKVIQIPTAPLLLDQWHVLTMVKIGNNFSCYDNSKYITSYFDNGTIGEIRSVTNIAPWLGTTDYDYYSLDAAPDMKWQKVFGGQASDTGYGVVATKDNGFAALGVTKSYGAGQFDAFLVRGDAIGNELWNRTYGSTMGDWSYSLSLTTDGGFLIGGASSVSGGFRAWMVKANSEGTVEWDKTYGDANEVGFCSIQTSDGGYALVGYQTVANRATDMILVKTDASGNQQWTRTYGGSSDDWAKSVIQTKDGGYAITGWTNSFGTETRGQLLRTDSSGVELYNITIGTLGSTICYKAIEMSDGGFVVTGHTNSIGHGANDIIGVRTSANGTIIWERTYGGAGEEYGSMVFALNDGFVFGGSTASFNSSLSQLFLVRTDLDGNQTYAGVYGLNVPTSGFVGAMTADGGFLGVGNTNNYSSGQDDLYVMRLAGYGAVQPVQSTPSASSTILQQALPPVAAVAAGTTLAFIGVFVVSRASEAVATVSNAYNGGLDQIRGGLRRYFRLDKAFDFVNGYFKGRTHSFVWKQVAKVELEDTIAVQRMPLFAGFSFRELCVIAFTAVFLGLAFMITNKIDLGSLSSWLIYIVVAGLAVSLHDLVHRYMAWRHSVVTEYKFWYLGTFIMFLTAILFGVVYSSPSRLAINDAKALSLKQQAIVYGSGPLVSFVIFVVFIALVPLGGDLATVGWLGASMNLLTAAYAMMPFEPMDGRKVYNWKKLAWAVPFVGLLVLYFALTIFVLGN
jgi:hypothetical protein